MESSTTSSRSRTSTTPPSLADIAEDSNAYLPVGPRDERIETERYVLWMGPGSHPSFTTVIRLRLTRDEVEPTVGEVRALLRERGRTAGTWEVGNSATPADLADRLQALGMVPDDEPLSVGMVLDEEPPVPAGVTAAPIRSIEELAAADDIMAEAFGMSEEQREEGRQRLAERWARLDPARTEVFLARLDGEPVAAANAVYGPGAVMLYAGATLPHARGRGAYRALVRARWDAGVARGMPALITQAGHMSRPILRRLGFREVAENRIFLDRFAGG